MSMHPDAGQHRSSAEVVHRLEALRGAAKQPGEARFFWFDTQFQKVAVKVLPGEYAAHREDVLIATTLGSCIACCVWDRESRLGGMNHFMLPDGPGEGGRFGAYAMEQLINSVLKLGGRRRSLEAKLFGGGQVLAGMTTMNIGERNTRFALDYLQTERIPVVSSDVLDIYPRKVAFLPLTGRAMVKRLPASQGHEIARQERDAQTGSGGGAVELF